MNKQIRTLNTHAIHTQETMIKIKVINKQTTMTSYAVARWDDKERKKNKQEINNVKNHFLL